MMIMEISEMESITILDEMIWLFILIFDVQGFIFSF